LTGLMSARELTNGFANRFLMIWAERARMLPFPKETPQMLVEQLAARTREVLAYVRADRHGERDRVRMELSPQAQWCYAQLYRGELNDDLGDGVIGALLDRRAPMLLRLAMLMALTDLHTRIDPQAHRRGDGVDSARHGVRALRLRQRRRGSQVGAGAGIVESSARLLERARRSHAQPDQLGVLPRQGAQSAARRQPGAPAGGNATQDHRAVG
jgi:hypothetical protein